MTLAAEKVIVCGVVIFIISKLGWSKKALENCEYVQLLNFHNYSLPAGFVYIWGGPSISPSSITESAVGSNGS